MTELLQFKALLESLQSAENDIRSAAESEYDNITTPLKFNFLMNVISKTEDDPKNRIFSGVLCRRLLDVSYDEAFGVLPPESQNNIKNELLQLIINENNVTVRKKLSEITSEIGKHQFNDDGSFQWTELLNFMFNICINNPNDHLKVIGLHLFTSLPNVLPITNQDNFNIIGAALNKCLSPSNEAGAKQSIEVREAAVKALCSLVVIEFEENPKVLQLRSLIPMLLQAILDSIQENPFEDNVMKSFIELVDDAPGFLKANVSHILQLCISILENPEVEELQKHLAIEIFVSLSETSTNAVRKSAMQSHTIIQYLFKMLTDIDDDPGWSNIDEEEIDDDSSNHVTAEIALDRLAVAMRGKRLLQEITQTVPVMLHSSDWKQRHGGLKAISSMGEGLQKVMSDILGEIISEVVQLLGDSHPRVRYAASVCLGQMSSDFEPKLQTYYHDKVMPALIAVLDDDANPRVQAYACSALTNFCEGASKEILCIYLSVLAAKLLQVLNSKCNQLVQDRKKLVLEQVVTTIAAVSDTAGDKFDVYYPSFMPIMKWIMQNCNSEELRLLRGKSIECISLMGLAVGKEKFLNDATEVMNLLVQTQTQTGEEMSADDPQHSYMISAWARICKLMGKDFAPYLKYVMGPVMKTASMKPDTCFMYDDETDDIDNNWQVVRVGQDQNVAINTSGIEDKINACQMLICYARELKEEFAPYVVEVAKIMLPLLKFYLNDDVRSAAADIIPFLIDSSIPLGQPARNELWNEMITNLLTALKAEEEKIQQADMLGAIAEGIEKMGVGCMNQEMLETLCELMKKYFDELFKNQEERAAKRKSDDYDDEEEENLESEKDDDDNILSKLVGISHSLFKVYKNNAFPFFQQISQYVIKLIDPNRPWTDLQYGLCFLDDLLEFTGQDSWQYCCNLLPVFRSAIEHPIPEVRQAAAYGFGLMAIHGGPHYQQFLSEVSEIMMRIMSNKNCRDVDNNLSTENVISALTKICKYQPNCILGGDVNRFLEVWLTWLPVYEDDEETPYVYGYLCELLENNNPVIIGSDNSNLGRVVKAIAICITKEALPVENEVYSRCLGIIRMIQTDEQFFNQCVQNLSDDEKMSLIRALDRAVN